MIRTCDPLIRSQVLYPTELRVRSANTKGCAAICKMPVSTREIARLRARGEVGIGDFDLDFVPLAARALALRLVRGRVKSSEIGRNLAIKVGHVLQLVNLVQVPASAISQRLQTRARSRINADDVRRLYRQTFRITRRQSQRIDCHAQSIRHR